jgi:predicted lysophospholipase L1 biosynthesis ABC-type transport system permease subunit
MAPIDRGLVGELLRRQAVVLFHGPAADAPAGALPAASLSDAADANVVMILGDESGILSEEQFRALGTTRVIVYDDLPDAAGSAAAAAGVSIRKLGIELRADELARLERKRTQARYRMYWIVVVSLLITVGGITNAMLMSVTERFREIATMKCLGALSSFVVKLFLIESSLVGFAGSVLGAVIGVLFPLVAYSYTYEFGRVFTAISLGTLAVYGMLCVVVGMILAVVAGIYPARVAARMVPAAALRSQV